jgi:hypothetical protein
MSLLREFLRSIAELLRSIAELLRSNQRFLRLRACEPTVAAKDARGDGEKQRLQDAKGFYFVRLPCTFKSSDFSFRKFSVILCAKYVILYLLLLIMNIIKLEGEDRQLYDLVAHLVMDEHVLSYNLNYPYRTASCYLWFIATHKGETLGFMPVKIDKRRAKINNYYIADDNHTVFSALLREILRTMSEGYELEAVTQIRHLSEFETNGFQVALYWKKYAKMKFAGQ